MDTGGGIKEDSRRLSAVRRDLDNVNDKLNIVDAKIEALNSGLYPVPGKIGEMDSDALRKAQRIAELEERQKIQSAKLHLLEKEITYVKTENDLLMDHITPRGRGGGGYNSYQYMDDHRAPPPQHNNNFYPDPPQDRRQTPDQRQNNYSTNGQDYNQQRTSVPGSPRKGDNSYEQSNLNTGRQVNQQQIAAQRNGTDPTIRDYDYEEMQRERRRKIYGFHDSTAINPQFWEPPSKHHKYPWFDHTVDSKPGGFLVMRFEDRGYDIAYVTLMKQQSIYRNAGGYLIGIARKDKIFLYEDAPTKHRNWLIARDQEFKDAKTTDNAMALFWFTSSKAAEEFLGNTHRNPFREPGFPTPNGYEAVYVPLTCSPIKQLNTFFFIEIMDAHLCDPRVMSQFEAGLRSIIERCCPNSVPLIVASQKDRFVYKPGPMISHNSKLFVSRLQSQKDADDLWKTCKREIDQCRQQYGLRGAINVYTVNVSL